MVVIFINVREGVIVLLSQLRDCSTNTWEIPASEPFNPVFRTAERGDTVEPFILRKLKLYSSQVSNNTVVRL